jgi:hypothetical protein
MMTPGNAPPPADLPIDLIRAWETAGAEYGWMRVDPAEDSSLSCPALPESRDEYSTVPGFAFSSWQKCISPVLIARLPIPSSPFGMSFGGCSLAPGSLKALSRFSGTLQELDLWGAYFSSDDVLDFTELRNLRGLRSSYTDISERIQQLARLPALETLRLVLETLAPAEVRLFSDLPRLKDLYLEGVPKALFSVSQLDGKETIPQRRHG